MLKGLEVSSKSTFLAETRGPVLPRFEEFCWNFQDGKAEIASPPTVG